MAVIETRYLRKYYSHGRIEALGGVSLTVERGEIYALLGPNGAGKTTLIKILLGITRYWSGEAELLGQPAGVTNVRKHVGYLPEDHRFPGYHSAYSLLHFYGQLLGVPRGERQKRIPHYLEIVGLKNRMRDKIRKYSKGMKQRLGIAQALFHDPEVIFLDEPTDGVDPVGRKEIRTMMQTLKAEGKTIFLNSHLLGEVELVSDRVGILNKGLMIREGTVDALTRQHGFFLIGLAEGQTLPEAELLQRGFQVIQRGRFWEIELENGKKIDEVVDLLRSRQLSIRHLVEKRQTLEELFMKTVEDDAARFPTGKTPISIPDRSSPSSDKIQAESDFPQKTPSTDIQGK